MSVELHMTHNDGGISPEDAHHRDVLRWRFKGTNGETDIPCMYFEEGRLWANTSTPRVAQALSQTSSSSTQGYGNPIVSPTGKHVPVRASVPRTPLTYGPPYRRIAVDVGDMSFVVNYVVKVEIGGPGGGVFYPHVDTCSPISWLCGFDRGTGASMYNHNSTEIPTSEFRAEYKNGGNVSGVVCKAPTSFDDGKFKFIWAFGVALQQNDAMKSNPIGDGVFALSFQRPPAGLDNPTRFYPSVESQTFMDYLLRSNIVRETTFCIRLRKWNTGTIIFGELLNLGECIFEFQDVVANHWALPSTDIGIKRNGHSVSRKYANEDTKENVALFDSGSAFIYLQTDVVKWLYVELCGEDNFFDTGGAFYLTPKGVENLKNSSICFTFGKHNVDLPARLIRGEYSFLHRGFFGTIQGKAGGPTLDNEHRSYDIYGTTLFKYVSIAFDAHISRPRIAICPNNGSENANAE